MPGHRLFREDFDRERDFVALRNFVFSAKGHVPGQPIDKTAFSLRRLRQMFDRRDVGYPSEYWGKLGVVPANGQPPPGPELTVVEQPRRGVGVPRYRSRQEQVA